MNKIRTTILSAAVAGGSIIGLAGVTGIVAATDTVTPTQTATDDAAADGPAALVGDDEAGDGTDLAPTDAERAARREARQAARAANRQAIADVLGLESDDLFEQVRAGATLADVAEAQGVATSDVVDLIVEQQTERIDAAVEAGRLTADEAAEKVADLGERVQTRVDEGRPERGEGEGRRGGRGHRNGELASDGAVADDAAAGDDAEG